MLGLFCNNYGNSINFISKNFYKNYSIFKIKFTVSFITDMVFPTIFPCRDFYRLQHGQVSLGAAQCSLPFPFGKDRSFGSFAHPCLDLMLLTPDTDILTEFLKGLFERQGNLTGKKNVTKNLSQCFSHENLLCSHIEVMHTVRASVKMKSRRGKIKRKIT